MIQEMMYNKVYVSLTVYHSEHYIDDKELVVACGYTEDNKLGYFVCLEDRVYEDQTNIPMCEYSNQYAFFQKLDENSYGQALTFLKDMVNPSE